MYVKRIGGKTCFFVCKVHSTVIIKFFCKKSIKKCFSFTNDLFINNIRYIFSI